MKLEQDNKKVLAGIIKRFPRIIKAARLAQYRGGIQFSFDGEAFRIVRGDNETEANK